MMEADIAGFVTIGLVVAFVAGQIFKTLRAFAAQKTVREAISRGTPVTPEMLVEAERSAEPGTNDMRNGMVLIALALAIVGFGLLQGSTDAIRGTAGIALFPLFVGVALLLRLKLAARAAGDA
jgi:hypothetical protein